MARNCGSSADLGFRKGGLRVAFVGLAATLVQIQAWRANLPYSACTFYSHDGALVGERYEELARRELTLRHKYRLR
jgi:hypothetical protein